MNKYIFDWSDLAFASKKPLRSLHATMIAAPRVVSVDRFKQLLKSYLPQGDIILGLAKEEYIDGFTNQTQFKTLGYDDISHIIDEVNAKSPRKVYVLNYFQREANDIYPKLDLRQLILINGSWHSSFHFRPEFYTAAMHKIPVFRISPFTDEYEAKAYCKSIDFQKINTRGELSDASVMRAVVEHARQSYDYTFQIGSVLAYGSSNRYTVLAGAHNTVIPYETYAMHHGSSRESNFSPLGDQNHYDAVHAEMMVCIKAAKERIDLINTTLFVNVLPCPNCARYIAATEIQEVVYQLDHSDGYAVGLLESAGKIVRRYTQPVS